ncbi:helix-turn-helix domain-containing protein [Scopulibacillus cellulosilyticus]|uniref:Helix-turn-helix domain-containing protein n=1 Tax=Scopulibacillus cellulosilyticus TaxID=2665665 RepID=A0ABW2Q188_9BACL
MGNTLGSRIRLLREKSDLSQKQLAEQLKISNVQLSRYESGDRKPDPEMIAAFAEFFKVPADFLLGLSSSIVQENTSTYFSQKDIALLKSIKRSPELESFIYDLLNHDDLLHKLKKIWMIIKE